MHGTEINSLRYFLKTVAKPTTALFILVALVYATAVRAENSGEEDAPYSSEDDGGSVPTPPPAIPAKPSKRSKQRKYFIPDTQRTDAGIFHVAFAAGGNFYFEPKVNSTTGVATGDYFKDFGFQGGVYFDYDYSQLTENVPFAIRGMVGYKYILSSVNVFTFDGMVRYMLRTSDVSALGLGAGVSAGVWYRGVTSTSPREQVLFLPSLILGAGFDFTPFMVDFKWLITRIGSNNTIMGWELYFGFRL
jgi:hypothetical protein